MSDRVLFREGARITEEMLNFSFNALEDAHHNLAATLGALGIVRGLTAQPQQPLADMSFTVAPGLAFDALGQRIAVPVAQTVDCTVGTSGQSTAVVVEGHERWLTLALRFARQDGQPFLDKSTNRVVATRSIESFCIVPRHGGEAREGHAERPSIGDGELLLCDVRLHYAQGCVEQEDIDTSRRRRFRFTNATAIDVDVTGWQNVEAAASAQDALEKIDAALTAQALAGRAGFNAAQMTLRQVQEQQRQDADDVEQMRAANQEAHTRQTAEMGHLATWVKQSKEELRLEMTAARAMADNTGRRVADIETEINTLKRLLSPRPRRPVAKRLCDTYIYRETVRDANIQGPGYFYAEVDIPGLRRSDHVTVSLDEKNDREYLHVNYGFVRDDRLQIILRSDGGNVYRHVGYTVIVQAFE